MDAADSAGRRVLPRVDGVFFLRGGGGVCVFPPELDVVVLVGHHGVRRRALAPAVASDASVPVEALPALDRDPHVLSVVPRVLLEGGFVDGEPDVHAQAVFKALRVCLAGRGRKLGKVGVAVVVAFPACLEARAGRVHGFELEVAEGSRLPDVGGVGLGYLLDSVVLVNVEDVELEPVST
jgi:hypothetical protein